MTLALGTYLQERDEAGLALAEDAELIARACHAVALRFHRGGRLLSFGTGQSAADAAHLAVEFVHPVIVGKRALPAFSLANDASALSGLARAGVFATQLRLLGRAGDIAVGITIDEDCAEVAAALAVAREMGMTTLALTKAGGLDGTVVDHLLTARSRDPRVARELQMTTYHVLWELVHVFLNDPRLAATEISR
ncbi:D-sedoheptulose-7-phosphate isomerase [Nonomuraea aurantiaca]|jgi:D-sedoheptulose 7-phosphate isomerase|uniref:D-sedoheptulose-7-phosphate isomerase n=1 Tax=Nonomuraea aurantiaca TaxID=2878562 RepID=UPI001CD9416E|nr:SIS domain-containing protein [Nonomuraea aurantiaca]MCA2228894.1 SIS domain-containing protein [Nonomuraea aurantiaca]